MAITTKDGLVASAARVQAGTKRRRIEVKRSFLYEGAPTAVGDRLEVSSAFAAELVNANKAVYLPTVVQVPEPEAAQPPASVLANTGPAPARSGPLADAARPVQTRRPGGGK